MLLILLKIGASLENTDIILEAAVESAAVSRIISHVVAALQTDARGIACTRKRQVPGTIYSFHLL